MTLALLALTLGRVTEGPAIHGDLLVGRHAELERIASVLGPGDGSTGRPAGLMLHGREGMGKTVLWQEAVRRAQEAGYRILECTMSQAESRLAFAGLADLIGPFLADLLPDLAAPQARALETALAIRDGDGSSPDERAVAFGLQGALAALSERTPIVLAIDDIQWLDPSSTLMLNYAVRRLRHQRLLLILARRDGGARDRRTPLVGESGLDLDRIPVGPLPLGAIHRMIRTRLGVSLTRPQLLRIHAASEGAPLHALELARAIDAGGPRASDPLITLLANRLAAMPEATRIALALVGIAIESDVDVLSHAFGAPLRRPLQPAIRAELVRIDAGRVRFSHPLIAAAAEASVSEAKRRELHLLLARTTDSQEIRATHLSQATLAADAAVATTIEQAAHASGRRGARANSAELFEAAARLTPSDDAREIARRRLAAAENWYAAGDAHRARDLLTDLLRSPLSGDQRGFAGWRLGVLLDEAGDWQAATALWRDVLGETTDAGLRSRLLCSLAVTAIYTDSVGAALAQAAAAVAAAEASRDAMHLARTLAVQASIMTIGGIPGQATVVQRAMELEAGIVEFLGEWSPSAAAAECARHTADIDGARRHYAVVLQRALEAGDANVEQWASFGLAHTELLAGNYRRASELADTALDIADQTGQMGIPVRALRAQIDAQLGALERARALVGEAIAGATSTAEKTHLFSGYVALGLIESSSDDQAAAARAYLAARRYAGEIGLAMAGAVRACLAEVETAAAAGEIAQAADAFATFESMVAGNPPRWAASIMHLARASMFVADGDLRAAVRELESAPDDESVLPLDRGRVLFMLGSICRRMREHGRARDRLEQALTIFNRLEAQPWTARTQRELRRIPGRRADREDVLTDAEARIAELVAAGRSNRDVASTLFLSVKTVEVTLTRIYQKVGVHSRTELANHLGSAARDRQRAGEPPEDLRVIAPKQ